MPTGRKVRGRAVAVQGELDGQLAGCGVVVPRRVVARDTVTEHQLDVVVERRTDKTFERFARKGDAAKVRRDVGDAHDLEVTAAGVVAHALHAAAGRSGLLDFAHGARPWFG